MTACNHASIVIDAPPDLVWDMTNDVGSWPQLFPDYAATDVVGHDGDSVRVRITMRPDERGVSHGWTVERRSDRDAGTATMSQVEGHAFEHMTVHWTYHPAEGGGVRLSWVHEFAVADGMRYDDQAMVGVLQRTVPVQLSHIRDRIEAEARHRAAGHPFRALLRLDVEPGTEERFEAEWLAIAEGIAREPGNRGQWLMRCTEAQEGGSTDGTATYYVVTEWTDADAFRTFEVGAAHVRNRRRLDVFRRGGARSTTLTTTTLVHELDGVAAAS